MPLSLPRVIKPGVSHVHCHVSSTHILYISIDTPERPTLHKDASLCRTRRRRIRLLVDITSFSVDYSYHLQMTCTGMVTGGKAHRVRVRGPRSKKACCNEKQPAFITNKHPQIIKVKDIDVMNKKKRSSSAPPYTHDVDADPHPYDADINKAGGDEWGLELERLVEDAENMMKVESERFEVMTWTPLPWPGSPTEELTTVRVDAMSMMDVKADDDTFIAYYNDPRCRHLLCNETCVDIEMGIRDARRAQEINKIVLHGFVVVDPARD